MSIPRPVAALAATGALLALTLPARAQVLRNGFWQPNGAVNATAYANGVLYVGGNFTHVAPITGSFAALDATTGALTGAPTAIAGPVNAIVPDGAGGWFMGGHFSSVQGQPRASLAHLDASGKVTAWNPGTDGVVYALAFDAFHPRQVFVSGYFTTLGGQSRTNLGAVDATTGLATSWQPTLTASVGTPLVYALQTRVGLVYLGGAFEKVNGVYRFNAATVDTNGTLTAFAPDVNGTVRAIAIWASNKSPFTVTEYVGGDFTRLNGQTANHLGALDASTGVTDTYAASLDGPVNALTLSVSNLGVSTVWAGGAFASANATSRQNLAAFDGAGNLKAWNPGTDGAVNALVYSGGGLLAGGHFHSAGGQPRFNLAEITAAGATTAWDPAPDSTVLAIGLAGNTVCAGGYFNVVGGVPRRDLAALDAVTGVPTAWNPSPRGPVTGLLVDGSNLYVGGQFDSIGGQVRSGAAQLALSTGAATAWAPAISGPVTQFLAHKGVVYVAGSFGLIGSQPRPGLGAIDASGAPTAWNPPTADNVVQALAANSSSIFLGGRFTYVGTTLRPALAAVDDATGGLRPLFNPSLADSNPGAFPHVAALVVSGSALYLGGAFTSLDGMTCSDFGAVDTTFGGPLPPETVANGPVSVCIAAGSTLYLAGFFGQIGATPTGVIGSFNLATRTVPTWDPNLRGEVHALAAGAGSVFAGGLFQGTWAQAGAPPLQTRLVAVSTAVTTVGPPGAGPAHGADALRVEPNPARAETALRFTLPRPGPATLEVFDLAGRRIRVLSADPRAAGEQIVTWDGCGARGERVPAGLYFVRLAGPGVRLTARVLRLD